MDPEAAVSGLVDLTDAGLDNRIGELELARRRTEAELAAAILLVGGGIVTTK